jgi:methylmalonyl-CoA mutase N-terminal domain/subunit
MDAATDSPQAASPDQDLVALLGRLAGQERQSGRDVFDGNSSTSADLPLPWAYEPPGRERPGEYPFSRGRTHKMYHDGLWVMGQYSGFSTPAETNARFRELIAAGQTGLSIALDLPTQVGLDSDMELAQGEVGRVGVPLDTVEDVLTLLDGVPLDRIRQVRTTANAIGPIFVALFEVALEELGVDPDSVKLIVQNDPLKEYVARGTHIFPPAMGLRLAVDVIEYFMNHRPSWEPIQFCGYHIRDAGGTAIHELAIATANGLTYLDATQERGLSINNLADSLYLFLAASVDIFEESAKIRAARRVWAKLLNHHYGVDPERSAINIFVYTLGGALTAQEPRNNIVRVTCEALAAVLGGAQTLATSSYDEALGLPTAEAARIALRTQQIIAYESGVTKVTDPLAGSYYVEDMTDRIERLVFSEVSRIVEHGGAIAALDSGLLHRTINDAAYELQKLTDSGRRPVVGVNVAMAEKVSSVADVSRADPALEQDQRDRLSRTKNGRDQLRVAAALAAVKEAADAGTNTIPSLLEATRARATVGEMVDALAQSLGRYASSALY